MDGDSFFASGAGKVSKGRKRKQPTSKSDSKLYKHTGNRGKKKAERIEDGLEVNSDFDSDESNEEEEEEAIVESAAEKRLRLAKEIISRLEDEERNKAEGENVDVDAIAHRLQDELAESKGTLRRTVATKIDEVIDTEAVKSYRYRGKPVTCIALSGDSQFIYCGSKDGAIIKWSFSTGERLVEIEGQYSDQGGSDVPTEGEASLGHNGKVLAIAVSTDGSTVASGGDDRLVCIWDKTLKCLRRFKGHRDAVTCLAFQKKSLQLFSGSNDRTIKVWALDSMSYVETLYGHQEGVVDIDSLNRARAVSCGGRDRSVRMWKIVEESQLLFEGAVDMSSIDCVSMITETSFVSGSQSGTLAIWDTQKKKPIVTAQHAHGMDNWIVAVSALRFGDVLASGSSDGEIRIWNCGDNQRKLDLISRIPRIGYINGLEFDPTGSHLIAAVAQEHRLGRWSRISAARNGCIVVKLFSD